MHKKLLICSIVIVTGLNVGCSVNKVNIDNGGLTPVIIVPIENTTSDETRTADIAPLEQNSTTIPEIMDTNANNANLTVVPVKPATGSSTVASVKKKNPHKKTHYHNFDEKCGC